MNKQTVTVKAQGIYRMFCQPRTIVASLCFMTGQVSWILVLVLAFLVGTNSPAFVLAFWVLAVASAAVWIIVATAIVRLAIIGARSLQGAGGETSPPGTGEHDAEPEGKES